MARAIDGAIKALVKKSATNPNSLQTGDNNNIAVWFVLLVVSLAVVGGTVFYGKKKSVK